MIRILVADDHDIFADGIKALLSDISDFEIIGSASNGEEVLNLIPILNPDIVLMDIRMPGKDGIETTQEISATYPHIKTIILTMLDEMHYMRKIKDAGAMGYLLKTTGKDDLIRAIRDIQKGLTIFDKSVFENSSKSTNLLDILTYREKEVLVLIAEGKTDKEIANDINLGISTIITHRKNLLSKLGLSNKVELAKFAIENHLV